MSTKEKTKSSVGRNAIKEAEEKSGNGQAEMAERYSNLVEVMTSSDGEWVHIHCAPEIGWSDAPLLHSVRVHLLISVDVDQVARQKKKKKFYYVLRLHYACGPTQRRNTYAFKDPDLCRYLKLRLDAELREAVRIQNTLRAASMMGTLSQWAAPFLNSLAEETRKTPARSRPSRPGQPRPPRPPDKTAVLDEDK